MGYKKIVHKSVDEVTREMAIKRKKAVEECLLIVQADAKLLCPVKTGTLKRSITHKTKSNASKTLGSVGSIVEYAYWASLYVPYLEPAVDKNQAIIIQKLKEVLNA
jgi:hypothetical protein